MPEMTTSDGVSLHYLEHEFREPREILSRVVYGALVRATQCSPPLLRAVREFEHRRQNARARAAATRLDRARANRGEGRFNRVGGAQVDPVRARKVVEGEQRIPILGQALGSLRIFRLVGLHEGSERAMRVVARCGYPDLMQI